MLISIIVPVYNSEKYIGRCINSIMLQSYVDWECILVDDGSTDNSLSMLQQLAKKDKRFKVFHQDNTGAGVARNFGIERASGTYVVFVDSDDMIKPDYLENLANHTEDVVFIDVNAVSENCRILKKEYISSFRDKSIDDIIRYHMTGTIPWGDWRKAVKLSLLNDNNIRYSDLRIGEEAIYSFKLLSCAESIGYIDKPVYMYVLRGDSLSQSFDSDPWGELVSRYKDNEEIYNELTATRRLDTLNSLNLCAAAISLDRIATYYTFCEYRHKAKAKIRRSKDSIIPDVGIDFKHLDTKSRIACRLIYNNCYIGFYLISKLKHAIRKWVK